MLRCSEGSRVLLGTFHYWAATAFDLESMSLACLHLHAQQDGCTVNTEVCDGTKNQDNGFGGRRGSVHWSR